MLVIDLNTLRWIEALPLAVLAADMQRHLRRPGGLGWISVPPKYGFLQRMNLFKVLGAEIPENFKRKDPTGRFVPLREIEKGREVPKVAQDIVATLRVDDPEAASVLRHCLGELVDNVFVHAASPTNAIVCAQHFPNAKKTQVGLVDTGVGFRATFEQAGFLAGETSTDRNALKLGLAPYVTSKPYSQPYASRYGRLGVGLFIVSETLRQVGGRLIVASGDAIYDRMYHRHRWHRCRAWQGSIIGFEIPDDPLVSYGDAIREARRLADLERLD